MGRARPRGGTGQRTGREPMPERVIKASFAINVVEDERNRLLLLKRALSARLGPGLWGFPGGHLEAGEEAETCALRELREELGPDFHTRIVAKVGPVWDTLYGGVYRIHLFRHAWEGGIIHLNGEHTDHAWVSREDFRAYPVVDGID